MATKKNRPPTDGPELSTQRVKAHLERLKKGQGKRLLVDLDSDGHAALIALLGSGYGKTRREVVKKRSLMWASPLLVLAALVYVSLVPAELQSVRPHGDRGPYVLTSAETSLSSDEHFEKLRVTAPWLHAIAPVTAGSVAAIGHDGARIELAASADGALLVNVSPSPVGALLKCWSPQVLQDHELTVNVTPPAATSAPAC